MKIKRIIKVTTTTQYVVPPSYEKLTDEEIINRWFHNDNINDYNMVRNEYKLGGSIEYVSSEVEHFNDDNSTIKKY